MIDVVGSKIERVKKSGFLLHLIGAEDSIMIFDVDFDKMVALRDAERDLQLIKDSENPYEQLSLKLDPPSA